MRLTSKSLILDLLSTLPAGRAVSVRALVRAASVLGIGENSVRVTLARLRARGLVESAERGLYRMGAAAHAVNRQVRSWRRVEDEVCDWDGGWVGVQEEGAAGRSDAGRRATALRLLGFQSLSGALHVRPDNLVGGVAALRERLGALGIGADVIVFALRDLDPERDARARDLWDVAALERGYDAGVAALEASEARLPRLAPEAAMAESFRLGGQVVRQIVLDPLLPAPIVDTDERARLVETMRRYDVLGRECWKSWAGETVELEKTPSEGSGLAAALTRGEASAP
ncbi:MAG: PaaX family transcriptional regulator [Myxococcota bacterium]